MKHGISLYFVRHGQTGWNHARRIQGQLDTDLNDTGRRQAAENGARLQRLRPDVANLSYVASPLRRCRETMEIIRDAIGIEPSGYTTDDRLKEIHFGHWQGTHWRDIEAVDPDGAAARLLDPYRWRPQGGESYADLTARVGDWLTTITTDTVVVAHGGVSRALRRLVLDVGPAEMTELSVPQDKILVLRDGEMAWA